MRHLVTGGSGFVGSYMARRLVVEDEAVRVVDVWQDPTFPKSIEYIEADILDRDRIAAAMKNIDVVHHIAALVSVTRSSARRFHEVNVIGTKIVAEEAARAGVSCFIYTSSSSIFGVPKQCPVDSNTIPNPLDTYAQSKLDGELVAMEIARKANMRFISVRPRSVLGDGRGGIFHILFNWIKAGNDICTIGSGENKLQFIHVDDFNSACLAILRSEQSGLYNVGTDRYGTLKETLQQLIEHAKSTSRIKSLPALPAVAILALLDKLGLSPLSPLHYLAYGKDFYCDLSALTKLGWRAKYSNAEMLCDSYDSFITGGDQFKSLKAVSAHRKSTNEMLLGLVKHLPC